MGLYAHAASRHAAANERGGRILFWGSSAALAALYCGKPFIHLPASETQYLASYSDDFFYYLVIAQHFVNGLFSTFDGLNPTNGYHPLWMGLLTGIAVLADMRGIGFFIVLQAVTAALGLLSIRLSLLLLEGALEVTGAMARVTALAVGVLYFRYSTMGMEINLAIPLILLAILAFFRFVFAPGKRLALWTSLAMAAAVLARIDSAIFFAALLLVAFAYLARYDRARLRAILTPGTAGLAALGAVPVLAYLAFNQLYFETPLPVSAAAKQLKAAGAPSFGFLDAAIARPLRLLLRGEISYLLTDVAIPALLLALRAAGLLYEWAAGPARVGRMPARILETAIILWVTLFYVTLALRSDWAVWDWYWYPLVIATLVSLPPVLRWGLARLPRGVETRAVALAAFPLIAFSGYSVASPPDLRAYRAAEAVAGFAQRHPGVYGQGDLAGLVTFLAERPVVQLEGLVNETAFLDYIRREAPLHEALADYGVDYYIGSRMETENGCHVAREPKPQQAGARSLRMEGRFCQAPVFQCCDGDGIGYRVFRVSR